MPGADGAVEQNSAGVVGIYMVAHLLDHLSLTLSLSNPAAEGF